MQGRKENIHIFSWQIHKSRYTLLHGFQLSISLSLCLVVAIITLIIMIIIIMIPTMMIITTIMFKTKQIISITFFLPFPWKNLRRENLPLLPFPRPSTSTSTGDQNGKKLK